MIFDTDTSDLRCVRLCCSLSQRQELSCLRKIKLKPSGWISPSSADNFPIIRGVWPNNLYVFTDIDLFSLYFCFVIISILANVIAWLMVPLKPSIPSKKVLKHRRNIWTIPQNCVFHISQLIFFTRLIAIEFPFTLRFLSF